MTKSTETIIAEAALNIAALNGWKAVSVAAIKQSTELSMLDLYEYSDQESILGAVDRWLDGACASEPVDETMSLRERLFDVSMLRFEAMENHRIGLLAMREHWKTRPIKRVAAAKRRAKTSKWIFACAGATAKESLQFQTIGFSTILFRAEQAWEKETGSDFTRTMSQLDRDLRDVDTWKARLDDMASVFQSRRSADRSSTATQTT